MHAKPEVQDRNTVSISAFHCKQKSVTLSILCNEENMPHVHSNAHVHP